MPLLCVCLCLLGCRLCGVPVFRSHLRCQQPCGTPANPRACLPACYGSCSDRTCCGYGAEGCSRLQGRPLYCPLERASHHGTLPSPLTLSSLRKSVPLPFYPPGLPEPQASCEACGTVLGRIEVLPSLGLLCWYKGAVVRCWPLDALLCSARGCSFRSSKLVRSASGQLRTYSQLGQEMANRVTATMQGKGALHQKAGMQQISAAAGPRCQKILGASQDCISLKRQMKQVV